MAAKNSWNWQVPAFEPRRSLDSDEEDSQQQQQPLKSSPVRSMRTVQVIPSVRSSSVVTRRLSLPAQWGSPFEEPTGSQSEIHNKIAKLRESLSNAKSEFLELRQEANDLQEYSSAKLARVTRYLGVLSDKTRRLDQMSFDYEHRLALVRKEKIMHFNELVSTKGNIRVFVRTRPLRKDESMNEMSFPDDFTVKLKTTEFRFDQVYGPHISQGEVFQDLQPFVQSAIDGYNVSIVSCGPRDSGKTYTMEGPSHDRGMYFRTFEELFDLCNGESTPSSKYLFYATMIGIRSEQVEDLLKDSSYDSAKSGGVIHVDCSGSTVNLVQYQIENPVEFAKLFKAATQKHFAKTKQTSSYCLVVTFHIHFSNTSTGEKHYSKLSLVDLPANGLKPNKSFSSLVSVISAVIAKREHVPYENSLVTQILSDSLGGNSKTFILLNINPCDTAVQQAEIWLEMAATCCKSQCKANEEENEEVRKCLNESEAQCQLLFKELQKAWQVAFTFQQEQHGKIKNDATDLSERKKFERDQILQLKTQVAQYARVDRDQKAELSNRAMKILALEERLHELDQQLAEGGGTSAGTPKWNITSSEPDITAYGEEENHSGELSKRDELIERLHEENEKLFQRLTGRTSSFSPKVQHPPEPRRMEELNLSGGNVRTRTRSSSRTEFPSGGTSTALQKPASERIKTTPAGEYLTAALLDFDPDLYTGPAAVSDAANKLLMLVLAAVIKAGAAREHDMLEEIRGAVFCFIRKLEPRKLMDTMLVSRVRILYVRSLLARSPELLSFKVPSVERFLEKGGVSRTKSSSSDSSPTRSPVSSQLESNLRKELIDENIPTFKVTLKQEKTSKLSSIVLKLRGIDQETWKQHLTGAKLREMNEDARNYAIGNKRLAALFVHTPAGELQRQIRNWLAHNFDFLSLTYGDNTVVTGTMSQLELLSTAIMDGWMAGLGMPVRPSTDALGQLLSDYTKHVHMSQLQNLKDVASALASEEAEDHQQATKIRSALESIDLKRRKILQQMRNDVTMLTKEEGGSPLRCPSTATEEARLASLISLEDILKQAEEIRKEAPLKASYSSKKKFLQSRLDSLVEQTSALLSIDHPCAHKFIKEARKAVEWVVDGEELVGNQGGVIQWSVLQFNNGTDKPLIIKCGATASMELVIKAAAAAGSGGGGEVVGVVPSPSRLVGLSLDEIKEMLSKLPEAFAQLAIAKTADASRARYGRLYKTLAVRVPALRATHTQTDLQPPLLRHARRASDSSEHLLSDG